MTYSTPKCPGMKISLRHFLLSYVISSFNFSKSHPSAVTGINLIRANPISLSFVLTHLNLFQLIRVMHIGIVPYVKLSLNVAGVMTEVVLELDLVFLELSLEQI